MPTALAVLSLSATVSPLAAQGITDAAIEGRVVSVDSSPVAQAVVRLTNASNGERWQTTTSARGRYFIEYLSVGGPYRIEVIAIGYLPARMDSVRVALGQRLTAHFTLTLAAFQLEEITVTDTDPGFDAARTGPSQVISDSTIARLPVNRRDYTDLALLSPQVTKSPNGGLSFAGQHDRVNSIQVDGANNNDPFGKSGSGNGTPGWAVGLSAFTPEAVRELQVVSAPFDVRYGSFAGGLINAVTRSGSNQVEGSILGYLASSDLVGADLTGNRGGEFSRRELGLTLGAPIVRDRVAVFINAAWNNELVPQSVPAPSSDTTGGADSAGVGVRYESLVRFQDLLRLHGAEPGGFAAGTLRAPTRNLFAKVTAQLGLGSRLMVSHDYGHGNVRDGTLGRGYGFYALSSAGTETPETIHATRLAWTKAFANRFSNKLVMARVDDRRTCIPASRSPGVSLSADESEVFAGGGEFCLGLETGHTMWEITDNLGMAAGDHRLMFGAHFERIDLVDDVLQFPGGLWGFDDLDALEQGRPAEYIRDIAAADSQVAFRVDQIGFYAQDQWLASPRLTMTAGVRLDVPFVPTAPKQHEKALIEMGINTALTPSGNPLWSPRLGVNYDLSSRGTSVLRGGAGFFAGHPAYVWFRNVYGTTGVRASHIDCTGENVPAFTLDPDEQPTECAGPEPSPPIIPLAYFDPDFRYPRALKVAVGVDQLLPRGVVATLDFLYSRTVSSVHMVDVNLRGPVRASAGEAGRVLYGTIDSTGRAAPSRRDTAMGLVAEMRNGSGDRSYSFTTQLSKGFPNGTGLSLAYTYTDAKDRLSMSRDMGGFNIGASPVNGTLEHRELRTSFWERPHKVTLVATTDLPLGLQLGLTYIGMSGGAYSYVLQGDANADGFLPSVRGLSNDAVYVPRDAGDITLEDSTAFPALDRLIRSQSCLRTQRGRLMERNSCRDPWVHETAASLSKRFRLAEGRTLEVTADLLNLLSLVNGRWGRVRQTFSESGNVALMELVGYDAPKGRGVYRLLPVFRREVDVDASRWRLQLGATLFF